MTALLIFDTEAGGHRANYFNCFIAHASAHPETGKVVFAIAPDLLARLEPQWRQRLKEQDGRLCLRLLTAVELVRANRRGAEVFRNFARWRLALRIAGEQKVSHVHFPLVDDVMKAAAVMPRTPYLISGIYFRPTTHFPENWRGVKGYLRQWGKRFFLMRYLARRDTVALLSFDAWFAEHAKAMAWGGKVGTLPEPIDPPPKTAPDVRPPSRRADEGMHFLFFGALQARKGLPEFLDALCLLPPRVLTRSHFTICGEGEMAELVHTRLPELKGRGVNLRYDNRFLSEAELAAEFARADVFLAPYRHHIGSSGAVYVAAQYRKPVITQGWGLIGRQVRRYRLGLAIDTARPEQIAQAIETLALGGDTPGAAPDYDGLVRGHGCAAFARMVFTWAMREPAEWRA